MPEEVFNEGQTEEVKKASVVFKNPFCGSPAVVGHPALDNRKAWRITSANIDKKTLCTSPVFEEYDSQEEIQKCKELCGIEYMRMLLKTGQAKAEDFYDDGKSGIDTTVFPESVHEAKKEAEKLNDDLSKLAQEVGAKEGQTYSAEQLEDLLISAVKEKFSQYNTNQTATAEGEAK